METIKCIKERRSIRKYKDEPVSNEIIGEIISAASFAPSWKNTQTSRYVVIKDKELKDKIADECVMGHANNCRIIKEAPVLVVLATRNERSGYERDGSFTTTKGTHFQSFDAGVAAEAFCLAAYDMGLGTLMMGIYDEGKVKEALEIGPEYSVSILMALGYTDELPDAPRRKGVEELMILK